MEPEDLERTLRSRIKGDVYFDDVTRGIHAADAQPLHRVETLLAAESRD